MRVRSSPQFLAQGVENPWRFPSDGVRGTSLVVAGGPRQPYLSLCQKGDSRGPEVASGQRLMARGTTVASQGEDLQPWPLIPERGQG